MRGPSPLSFQLRETLGAYVSALNGCDFCFGAHSKTAKMFGLEENLWDALLDNIDTAAIPDKEKSLFHYARKLTLTPSRVIQSDVQAIYDMGWSEDALHSVMAITCTFNFMNRIAPGMGIDVEKLDLADLGAERHSTAWEPMVPIETAKLDDNPEEAYRQSPPNWNAVWKLT